VSPRRGFFVSVSLAGHHHVCIDQANMGSRR
jgi:hypothetical protein